MRAMGGSMVVPMAGLLSSILWFGCGGAASGKPILIGALVPRTGPIATAAWVSAIELGFDHMTQALAMANARGIHLTLETRDSSSDAALSTKYTQELVKLGAKALTAESSDSGKGANMANYQPGAVQTPIICFVCTSSNINNPAYTDPDPVAQAALRDEGNWLFRTAALTLNRNELAIEHVAMSGGGDLNGDGVIKVVIISTTDTSGLASVDASIKQLKKSLTAKPLLIEVLLIDSRVGPESADYATVMQKAHDKLTERDSYNAATMTIETAESMPDPPSVMGPDFIWNKALTAVSIGLIRAYAVGGYTTKVLNDDTVRRQTVLTTLGALANGQEGTSLLGAETDASGQVFAAAQKARTGFDPIAYESNAYDAMVMVELGTVKAALPLADPTTVTPAQVREAITQINDPQGELVRTGPQELARGIDLMAQGRPINYQGASGPVDFDAVGNVRDRLAYWRIEDVRYVDLAIYDCITSDACPPVP